MPNTHSTLTSLFSDIADAIRGKTGSSATIVADNFPTAIASIPTGGGSATIEPLSVTANGTYTAPSGVDGYSPITVNVPSGGSGFEDITADFNFVIGINTVSPTSFSALFNSTEYKLVMSGLFESIDDFVTVSYDGDNEDVLSALSSTAVFGFDSDAESGFTEYFSADGSATFYAGSMTYIGYLYGM